MYIYKHIYVFVYITASLISLLHRSKKETCLFDHSSFNSCFPCLPNLAKTTKKDAITNLKASKTTETTSSCCIYVKAKKITKT